MKVRGMCVPLVAMLLVASSAEAARPRCVTKKDLKVSLKNRDKTTTWMILKAGSDIEIRNRAKDWTEVGTADGFARAATVYLAQACTLPPRARTIAPATTVAAAPTPDWAKVPTTPKVAETPASTPVTAPVSTPVTAPVAETPATAVVAVTPSTPAPEPEPEWTVPKGVVVRAPEQAQPATEDTVQTGPQLPWDATGGAYEDLEIGDVTSGVARRLVAVLDLKANESAGKIASALTTVLNADLGSRDGLRTISRNEVKSVIEHQATSQLLGCESVGCAADLAKLLDAELVVAGSVEVIENAHVMSVSLIDPTIPRVLGREELAWRGDPDEMIGVVGPIVDRLLAGARAGVLQGTVEVFAPDGAAIIVDGIQVGTAPLSPQPTSVGVHQVLVTKDGYEPATYDVAIGVGVNTIVRSQLIEQPYYTQWWFWTATGGGLLAAAGVAVGVTTWGVLENAKTQAPRAVLGSKE
jgi:hypothetical protein